MEDREAFALLLSRVRVAIEKSLARYTAAIELGDLEAMQVEQERQTNLLNARNQLEVLQELWPKLIDQQELDREEDTERGPPPTERRTPWQAFVVPILQTLEGLGGSAKANTVIDRVGRRMAGILTEFDRSPFDSGGVRWRTTAQNARQRMIKQGLLASDSPPGTWEITDKGRERLHGQKAPAAASGPDPLPVPEEGLPILARYRGRRYDATLLPDRRVLFDGKEYGSPSGAGVTIVPYDTLNGWQFWRYVDDKGEEHPISDLRE